MTRFWDIYESPIGPLTLISSDLGLTGIAFPGRDLKLRTEDHEPALLEPAAEQLEQYFNGERRSFELELDVTGSAFQVSIRQRLLEIPYGATITTRSSPKPSTGSTSCAPSRPSSAAPRSPS